jgi:transcriptional antiterminator RfaH
MKQWYALRSKPRQEALAMTLLTGAGIEVFFPRQRVHKQHGKPPASEPLFPGYLFGRLDPELAELRLASYTPGIHYVVGYGGEPYPVPDDLILYIRQRLDRRQARLDHDDLRHGDRLVILSGPLRGVEAIFDRHLSATGRVRILVQILKRLCPAEAHVRQLRRISKAASLASI